MQADFRELSLQIDISDVINLTNKIVTKFLMQYKGEFDTTHKVSSNMAFVTNKKTRSRIGLTPSFIAVSEDKIFNATEFSQKVYNIIKVCSDDDDSIIEKLSASLSVRYAISVPNIDSVELLKHFNEKIICDPIKDKILAKGLVFLLKDGDDMFSVDLKVIVTGFTVSIKIDLNDLSSLESSIDRINEIILSRVRNLLSSLFI